MNVSKNDIKKDLYKSKVNAKFSHYIAGNLYYNVIVLGGEYQFPISTISKHQNNDDAPFITLSEDLGTTPFGAEIKGSELNRWISKAVDNDEFIYIGIPVSEEDIKKAWLAP